jgi:hypothetical protein
MKTFALLAVLASVSAFGQNPVEGMPNAKGVYYKSGENWSSLAFNMMYPAMHNLTAEYFSVGKRQYIAEVPGQHAMLQVGEAQPVFFVRGLTNGISPRLVQFTNKKDHRQVTMKQGTMFTPEVPIADKEMRDIEVAVLSENIIAVRPKGNLPVGEYAIVTNPLEDSRRMMMSFEFRVVGR